MTQDALTIQEMEHRLRGPSCRWMIAERRAGSQRGSWTHDLDEPTQQAVAYLRHYAEAGPEGAERKYPTVAAACALRGSDGSFQTFKICLLGALPSVEIAARLGIEQDVIELAEALFFDIWATRDASDWMRCQVFLPEVKADATDAAAKMKLAFHGGPATTRALLDAAEDLPLEEAQRLVDQEALLHGKLQAALEYELDAGSAAEFLKTFLAYDIDRQKLRLEREQFEQVCRRKHEKHSDDDIPPADVESTNATANDSPIADDNADGRTTTASAGRSQHVA